MKETKPLKFRKRKDGWRVAKMTLGICKKCGGFIIHGLHECGTPTIVCVVDAVGREKQT